MVTQKFEHLVSKTPHDFTFLDFMASLEELLVKQFRGLQSLVQITTQEQMALSIGDANSLVQLTREKDRIIEQIEIMVDSQHMVLEEIGKILEINKKVSFNVDILPRLDPTPARRISRLRRGIMSLHDKAGNLNQVNQALASNSPDRF